MKRLALFLIGGCGFLGFGDYSAASDVRWSIGVNVGAPRVVVAPRPFCHSYPSYQPYHYHYHPRPIYYEPAPIIVRPAPVIYQAAPVYVPAPAAFAPAPVAPAPNPIRTTSGSSAVPETPANIDAHLHLLRNPDEKVRADAALELGRSRADRAVDPLAATLAGDKSPSVRDAAARALGLLGSPRALTALTYAAAADSDRDVRRSAQFSVEVIRSRRD